MSYLKIIILSLIPAFEGRYAIPVAILHYKINPLTAYILASLGTLIALIATLLFLNHLLPRIKGKSIQTLFQNIFHYTHKRHSKLFEEVENLGIILFIAIPLPGTGVYTGSIICYLLGFSLKRSIVLNTIGMLIAGLITLIMTVGIGNIISAS